MTFPPPTSTPTASPDMETRLCKVCKAQKPVSEFRTGTGGRVKTICRECTDGLIAAYLGEGLRRCATCGRPTCNYRCAACWAKIRGGENDGSGLDPMYLP